MYLKQTPVMILGRCSFHCTWPGSTFNHFDNFLL